MNAPKLPPDGGPAPDDVPRRDHDVQQAHGFSLSEAEKDEVEEKLPPRPTVLHEIIRVQGETELSRSTAALVWSSLAAGLSMGFSMLARAVIHAHMGDTPARYLVENLGYSMGFLIVVLARQQLFTENTMTGVLPLMTRPSWRASGCLLRLWSVALCGNLVGVALFAWGVVHLPVLDAAAREAIRGAGEGMLGNAGPQMFTRGILAGWLIAVMVWLVPAAEQSKVPVIVVITWLVGAGGFTHIIAGSTEVLYLVFDGRAGFLHDYLLQFALPTLGGNIVGGSLIFALISHAQVRGDEGGLGDRRDRSRSGR